MTLKPAPQALHVGSSDRRTFGSNFSGETWYSSTPADATQVLHPLNFTTSFYCIFRRNRLFSGGSTLKGSIGGPPLRSPMRSGGGLALGSSIRLGSAARPFRGF